MEGKGTKNPGVSRRGAAIWTALVALLAGVRLRSSVTRFLRAQIAEYEAASPTAIRASDLAAPATGSGHPPTRQHELGEPAVRGFVHLRPVSNLSVTSAKPSLGTVTSVFCL
jgi:hypothetical protein